MLRMNYMFAERNFLPVNVMHFLGSLYTQAEETDLAIQYYEESLELCKQHGKASTDLMKLYFFIIFRWRFRCRRNEV